MNRNRQPIGTAALTLVLLAATSTSHANDAPAKLPGYSVPGIGLIWQWLWGR